MLLFSPLTSIHLGESDHSVRMEAIQDTPACFFCENADSLPRDCRRIALDLIGIQRHSTVCEKIHEFLVYWAEDHSDAPISKQISANTVLMRHIREHYYSNHDIEVNAIRCDREMAKTLTKW